MIHHLTRATRILLFYLLIAIAIGLSLMRLFLFAVEFYRTDLENKIFELTSIPVKIGKLQANLRGINPEVILKDIQILAIDEQGNPYIELEQVRVGIELMQLLSTRQLFPSSWLTLVGAKLSIVRHEDGTLSIAGLNSDDSEQPLWLLSGGRYEVLKSEITWLDQQRQRLPVTFNDVDLLIRNDADAKSHELHLLTLLPEKYGDKLRVSMFVRGNFFALENLNGWVYVEGDAIHLSEVFTEEVPFGIEITDLQKTEKNKSFFKVWSQWEKSSLKTLSGSFQAKNVGLKQNKKIFDIKQLDTEFNVSLKETGWQLGVKDFFLTTGTHEWSNMGLIVAVNQQLTHLSASIEQVELQELAELVDFFVPVDEEYQALIADSAIKGQLKNFSIYADTESNSYAVNGDFNNVFVNAVSGFPQIKNLTGAIKGSDEIGKIRLFSEKGSLFYPQLFRKAISIDNLYGSIEWQQHADKWLIKSESLMLDNKDIETVSQLSLIIPKNDGAVFMDLQASFANMQDISSLVDYYPVANMKKEVLDWLDGAFVSGTINKGKLLVYGELDQFPFVDGQGMFEALIQAKNLELNYSPEWPHLKNLDARILFTKNTLSVDITGGNSHGMEINDTSIKIASFETPNIQIQGQFNGSIVNSLTYLQQTPFHRTADDVLDAITPKGLTQINLNLEIPLSENPEIKLNGVAHINKASLMINAIGLNMTDFEGELRFSEKGMFTDNLKAKSLGYPLDINIDNEELKTVITAEGEMDYLQLKNQFDFLQTDLIKDEHITGSSTYKVTMNIPAEEDNSAKLAIQSNLTGIGFDFPGTFKKLAEQETPLLISMPLNKEELLPVSINFKDELKVAINVDRQQSAMHSAHIVYGKGDASIRQRKGVSVHIDQEVFDGSEWMGFVQQALNSKEDLDEEIEAEVEASHPALNNMVLKTKGFQWEGQSYGPFEMILQQQKDKWQGNILSSIARGAFIIPFNQVAENKIKLEMERLDLTQLMTFRIPTGDKTTENMPLIDVVSQQLWWKSVNLGKLELATEKLVNGISFKHINVISKDHKFKLNGKWTKTDVGSVTNIKGNFKAKDFGKLLSQLDITDDIKEAHGKLDFSARWLGLPYQFSLAAADAEIDLAVKNGRISSIEPGFGRLLGLLAMGQWIKRLNLDFGDIFKGGLSFNKITGHFALGEGKLSSRDLLVDAVPANISIRGGVNLLEKTLDQRIQVVPKSSNAIPIAGPIVEGIAGAITQVFDKNYKEGYFFGSEYEVSGKWDNLKVTPLLDRGGLFTKTWSGLTDFSWMKQDKGDGNK